MKQPGKVIRLNRSHVRKLSKLCAVAFFDNPSSAYIFPGQRQRIKKLRHLFQFALTYGILYGEAYSTSHNIEGFAVWLKSKHGNLSLHRLLKAGILRCVSKIGITAIARLMQTIKHSVSMHNKYMPDEHWILYLIAVHPAHQKKGHAGVLIRYLLDHVETQRLPCVLETSNKENVSLYEHFGFRLKHHSIVPHTSINMWIMARS